jgi:hypothetical protein
MKKRIGALFVGFTNSRQHHYEWRLSSEDRWKPGYMESDEDTRPMTDNAWPLGKEVEARPISRRFIKFWFNLGNFYHESVYCSKWVTE